MPAARTRRDGWSEVISNGKGEEIEQVGRVDRFLPVLTGEHLGGPAMPKNGQGRGGREVENLFGKQGSQIKQIKHSTEANVQVSKKGEYGFNGERVCTIQGSLVTILKASAEILSILQANAALSAPTAASASTAMGAVASGIGAGAGFGAGVGVGGGEILQVSKVRGQGWV